MVCIKFGVLSPLYLVIIFTIFIQIDSLCIDKYGNYVNTHLEHIQSNSHFRQKPGKFSRKQECLEVFKGVCFIQENQRNEWAQCISISNHRTQRAKRHECCYVFMHCFNIFQSLIACQSPTWILHCVVCCLFKRHNSWGKIHHCKKTKIFRYNYQRRTIQQIQCICVVVCHMLRWLHHMFLVLF